MAYKRMDLALYPMHKQCEKLTKECKEMQSRAYKNWNMFGFFMIFFITPILLIASYDLNYDYSIQVLLVPATITWLGVIILQLYTWKKIKGYYDKVHSLHKTEKAYQSQRTIEDFKNHAWP